MEDNSKMVVDDKMENTIGNILRLGVMLAAAFVLLGGVIYLLKFGLSRPDYVDFSDSPDSLNNLKGIIQQAFHLDSQGLIQLGLIFLIATPIARVIFSFVSFLRERDYFYTFVTLLVLIILTSSLIGWHL
jgi:uncharacterized membrane protein